jgi:uncharacterized protein YbaA (DUF1428 family)
MPQYVDGFILVVPRKKVSAYRAIARKAGKVWKQHGALDYVECQGENLISQWGTPFPRLLKLKPGETVWFSWIVYKSKAHRNQVNKRVMRDRRILDMMKPGSEPFDMKRMSYGGFKMMVRA